MYLKSLTKKDKNVVSECLIQIRKPKNNLMSKFAHNQMFIM